MNVMGAGPGLWYNKSIPWELVSQTQTHETREAGTGDMTMKLRLAGRLAALLTALAVLLFPLGIAEESPWDADTTREVQAPLAEAEVPEAQDSALPGEPVSAGLEFGLDVAPEPDPAGINAAGDEEQPPAGEETAEPEQTLPALEETALKLGVKEKYVLKLSNGAIAREIGAQFASSNAKVAAVNAETGEITPKKTGRATVTMTVQGAQSACEVTVLKAPSKITLSGSKLTLGAGESRKLKATLPKNTASAVTFKTSNAAVVSVDGDGNITALKKGTATVTARTFNGKKAACKVTVKAAPKSVSINPGILSLWEGESYALKPVLSKNSAGAISYAVSDDSVVSLSGNRLKALVAGSSTVTVTTYNGKSAEMSVEVSRKPVYRALLVGESSFPNTGLNSLPGRRDVALVKKMLDNVKGAAGVKWKVSTRYDRTSSEIRGDILAAFEGAQEGDVSLFYISTHGDQDITIDGNYPEYAGCLQTYPDYDYSGWYDRNALTLVDLAQWLGEVPGQVIVLIDSCGSGAAIYTAKSISATAFSPEDFDQAVVEAFEAEDRGVLAPGMENGAFVVRNKFYVMTSAAYLETGWSLTDKYSYFTKWMTTGIGTRGTMPADSNRNKLATLDELYKYVCKQAEKKTFRHDGISYKQHVQVYPAGSGFELFYRK